MLWPMIVLQGTKFKVLTQALSAFSTNNATDYGPMMAVAVLITIPVILVYMFAQKYFTQGIALTGIKG